MPKLLKFDAGLLETTELNDTVKQLTFSVPDEFSFKAGQFVTAILFIPEGEKIRRSYSIASNPTKEGVIELCIKYVENGVGSTFFHEMKVGEQVHFRGPMGTFGIPEGATDMVFVGVGTGIAPLRSLILDIFEKEHDGDITLVMGYRHEKNVLYDNEFNSLAEKHKNFSYSTIFTQPDATHTGQQGRVQKLVETGLDGWEDAHFFLCGLGIMVKETAELIATSGIPKERIHFEKYD